MIEFHWNPRKARENLRKRGVTFEEAKSVFFDDYAVQFFDSEHSDDEDRFVMLGFSRRSRILVVCHCEREDGNVIRIISARRATATERSFYRGPTP